MNLMVGESHVGYAFGYAYGSKVNVIEHNNTFIYSDFERGWTGFSYLNGLTVFSVSSRLEQDLQNASIKISDYKNIVFVFGTNDAFVSRENSLPPEEYVYKYVDYIESVRDRYGMNNAYVTTPWHIRHDLDRWSPRWDRDIFNEPTKRDELIVQVNAAIINACQKYTSVHAVPMPDLFSKDEELFHDMYTFDGIHLNELGCQMFFDVITQAIEQRK